MNPISVGYIHKYNQSPQGFTTATIDELIIHKVAKSAEYIYNRARPGAPAVRFEVGTADKADNTTKFPYHDYRLYWDNPMASNADTSIMSAANGYAGWWRFDEGSGLEAIDRSANKANATLAGATYVSDTAAQEGFALQADGSSNVFAVNPFNLNMDQDFTVEMHVRPDVSKMGVLSKISGNVGLSWNHDGAGIDRNLSDGSNGVNVYGVAALGSWFAEAVVVDWTNKSASGYTNWMLDKSESLAMLGSVTNGGPLEMGPGNANKFTGRIDELRIMSRALEPAELLHFPLSSYSLAPVQLVP